MDQFLLECMQPRSVTIRCSEKTLPEADSEIFTKKIVNVTTQAPRGLMEVGRLEGNWGDQPILVDEKIFFETLKDDVAEIFERLGNVVSNNPAGSDIFIQARVSHIEVKTATERWYDLKGRTEANIIILLETSELNEGSQSTKEYKGYSSLDVFYVYLKDNEELLGSAYCDALTALANDVRLGGTTATSP